MGGAEKNRYWGWTAALGCVASGLIIALVARERNLHKPLGDAAQLVSARAGHSERALDDSNGPSLDDVASLGYARAKARIVARQWTEGLAQKLTELRDAGPAAPLSCTRFAQVSISSSSAARSKRGCVANPAIDCLESTAGFFVPLDTPTGNFCDWSLWYVPKRGPLRGPRELNVFAGFVESKQLGFTIRMFLVDLTGDGVDEAVVVRGRAGSSGQSLDMIMATGVSEALPFDDLRDVDSDGLLDGVVDFRAVLGSKHRSSRPYRAPVLVAHRTEAVRFDWEDAVSKGERAQSCRPPLTPVAIRGVGGRVMEEETIRRSICRCVEGAREATVLREVRAACENAPCAALIPTVDELLTQLSKALRWRPADADQRDHPR
ncbi:MAG TPA: hypothetical protein VFQ61_04090 [Polyangiaceae bacterium]|nr:hypothetical protein [Polyangiaceae bacterium]